MHMADALISPIVGGGMWAVTAGLAAYAAHKVKNEMDEHKVPLMGVLGAFVFSAQMINFSIPATGSSGHLTGALILSSLLGPYAAFLTMISILSIQALFFADGGLLALGCNIFNMGFFPCFIAYPLIFKPLVGKNFSKGKLFAGSVLAAVIGLQLGAFSVVLETFFSGISELPFSTFVLLMQPIHLGIGLVEGIVTAVVLSFVWSQAPAIMQNAAANKPLGNVQIKKVAYGILIVAMLTAGMLSWFASANPDGLEWSIANVTGKGELETGDDGVHTFFADLQKKVAFLPDYNFKQEEAANEADKAVKGKEDTAWPAVDSGTSAAGVVGSILTLVFACVIAKTMQMLTGRKKSGTDIKANPQSQN